MILPTALKVVLCCSVLLHYGEQARAINGELDGHRVLRIRHEEAGSVLDLQQLDLDIWSINLEQSEMVAHVDEDQYFLLGQMPELKISVLEDQLDAVYNEPLRRRMSLASRQSFSLKNWFHDYHRYEDIKLWYENLAKEHSDQVTFVPSIGKTCERRDIFAVHINLTPPNPDKKQIWIQGLIHAREWISGSVVQYLSDQLLKLPNACKRDESSDPQVQALYNLEIIIIPVVNPDGYHHSWTKNRLWRKNMSKNIFGQGVDLNRNFESHWGTGGSSKIPVSDTYQGPHAASEPETRAIEDYFLKQNNVVGAIDWHAYSQLILFPYGWTQERIANYDQYKLLGHEMEKAFALNGRKYATIQSCKLYTTSGGATDWFVDKTALQNKKYIPIVYAIELPPSQDDGAGFLLDRKFIIPTGEESWQAFLVFAHFTFKNSQLNQGQLDPTGA